MSDLRLRTFGKLSVVGPTDDGAAWRCLCTCGKSCVATEAELAAGKAGCGHCNGHQRGRPRRASRLGYFPIRLTPALREVLSRVAGERALSHDIVRLLATHPEVNRPDLQTVPVRPQGSKRAELRQTG